MSCATMYARKNADAKTSVTPIARKYAASRADSYPHILRPRKYMPFPVPTHSENIPLMKAGPSTENDPKKIFIAAFAKLYSIVSPDVKRTLISSGTAFNFCHNPAISLFFSVRGQKAFPRLSRKN